MTNDHFKGKEVVEHLYEARIKGQAATAEVHGAELPGHFFSCFDAIKETAFLVLIWEILFLPFFPHSSAATILALFLFLILIYKFGRSSLLGWIRLQRLHRLIEEERWEIEHHRQQERNELVALYRAKGFSGKLLEEVVDVLMADDNRLLQVMLEEELGLSLEAQEHPLKQGFGASLGVLISGGILFAAFIMHYSYVIWITALILVGIAAGLSARKEKNPIAGSVIWNVSLLTLIGLVAVFLKDLFS